MNRRPFWAFALAALLVAAIVGAAAYLAGESAGLAAAASAAVQAPGANGSVPPAPYPYAWHYYRPHPFGFFGPVFAVLLLFLVFRALMWGGPFRRGWYARGYYGGPAAFDEWHERAHARMKDAKEPSDDRASR
jgi:hypothetical protein